MGIHDYKIAYFSKIAQIILFDKTGKLIDSCNTLIDTTPYQQKSLFEAFPFLDSLKAVLINWNKEQASKEPLYFPRVEWTYNNKEWIFDFTLYKDTDKGAIVWLIQDLSKQYEYLLKVQQERNETIIKKEYIELKNKALVLHKEIEILNKVQALKLAYFTKITQNIKIPLHEINNIAYLVGNHIEAKGKEHFDKLTASTQNLLSMLTSLLNSSKLNTEPMQFEQKEFLLSELIWSVIKLFDLSASKRTIPILFEIAPNISPYLQGDPLKLSHILYSVIHNILKIKKEGEITIDITEHYKNGTTQILQFNIVDKGTVISPQQLAYLFDPYKKVENETFDNQPTDINLEIALAKQFIEQQGGKVTIESEKDKGTSVSFTLPFSLSSKN